MNNNIPENEVKNGCLTFATLVITLTTIGWLLSGAFLYNRTFDGSYNLQLITCFWTIGGIATGCILSFIYWLVRRAPEKISPHWLAIGCALISTSVGILLWTGWKNAIFNSTDDLQMLYGGGIGLILPVFLGSCIGSVIIAIWVYRNTRDQ